MILFLKHIEIEGPDRLEEIFTREGFPTGTLELHRGVKLPRTLEGLDAVVSLGGPMSVYDGHQFPFLDAENDFIQMAISAGLPFLGVCLGAQMFAKACGARVGKSPQKEIGMLPVSMTGPWNTDPLFKGLPAVMDVFHWHEDMANLPAGAVLLASSPGCPHQAFRVGDHAYGLQFHIEVVLSTVKKWAEVYFPSADPLNQTRRHEIIEGFQRSEQKYRQLAETVCGNFLEIIKARGASRVNSV